MVENKQVWETITLKYGDKTLKKKGGEGDKAWKLYEVVAESPIPNSKFPIKFTCFGSVKGIEHLNEDNVGELLTYKCLNEAYTNDYGNQMSRKIVEVTLPKEGTTMSEKVLTRDEFYAGVIPGKRKETTTASTKSQPVTEDIDKEELKKRKAACKISKFMEIYFEEKVKGNNMKQHEVSVADAIFEYMYLVHMNELTGMMLEKRERVSKLFMDEYMKQFDRYKDGDMGLTG